MHFILSVLPSMHVSRIAMRSPSCLTLIKLQEEDKSRTGNLVGLIARRFIAPASCTCATFSIALIYCHSFRPYVARSRARAACEQAQASVLMCVSELLLLEITRHSSIRTIRIRR